MPNAFEQAEADAAEAEANKPEGPTETLWKTPLPKRAVDEDGAEVTLNQPSRNIDAVLVFNIVPRDDVGLGSSWQRLETSHSYEQRLHVLKCLHAKGLQLTQSLSICKTQWIIRISAPSKLLEKTAERMGGKFKTKLKNSQEDTNQGKLNGYAEFRCEKKIEYQMAMTDQFPSVERQRIIMYMIEKSLGGDGMDYKMIKQAENSQLFHLFPTHDPNDQADLNLLWVQSWRSAQPLDSIRSYFGEEIALYFAFLGQYTCWLAPIAGLGIWTGLEQASVGNDTVMVPVYCMSVAIWSILFLEMWKRYQAVLQLRWDVREFESEEVDRIDFYGEPRVSPITGEDELCFDDEERRWKYAVTYPIMGIAIFCVVIAAVGVVVFQYFAVHSGKFGDAGAMVSGVVNAMVINLMNMLYERLALAMNTHENHQTQTDFNDALIMKVFIFQFVNSYAAVTYMAFLAGRVRILGIDLKCTRNGCLQDIHSLIFFTLLLQIMVGNLIEVCVPYVTYQMQQDQAKADREATNTGAVKIEASEQTPLVAALNSVNPFYDEDDELLATATEDKAFELPPYMAVHEIEAIMPVYESTFSDYNELVIQFGYVVLFAMALPWGSALCLVNNMIEIRSDAFKLVNVYQRPFYRGAQDIGTWYDILRLLTILGVLFNCGMMAFTSNMFLRNNWVDASKVGIVEMLVCVFVAEHVALIAMVFCADFIPDEPAWIAEEEERLKEKADLVLRTKDDVDKSRETLRIYNEMRQLIDEHDIAMKEDIQVRKWRKQPQYGSGLLAGASAPEVMDGDNAGKPAKWLEERERQIMRKEVKKAKQFTYDLY